MAPTSPEQGPSIGSYETSIKGDLTSQPKMQETPNDIKQDLGKEKLPSMPLFLKILGAVLALGVGATVINVDNRIKNNLGKKPLDLRLIDHMLKGNLKKQSGETSQLLKETEMEVLKEIETVYSQVWRWHGTGRFEYRDENTIDVLKQIISDNGLIPQPDKMDTTVGAMESISTASSRMYARPYADMHNDRDKSLSYRYGKGSFWSKYFMAPAPVEGAIELKLWQKEPRDKFGETMLRALHGWKRKINKTPRVKGLYNGMNEGSDIKNNYPILIGLKQSAFVAIPISKTLSRHESRSTDAIPFSAITHIEVPSVNVEETRQLLIVNGLGSLPVIPIEVAEYYCSKFKFSDLVSGRPLTLNKI